MVLVGVSDVMAAIGKKLGFSDMIGVGVSDLLATKLTLPVSSWTNSPEWRVEVPTSVEAEELKGSVELSCDDDWVGSIKIDMCDGLELFSVELTLGERIAG